MPVHIRRKGTRSNPSSAKTKYYHVVAHREGGKVYVQVTRDTHGDSNIEYKLTPSHRASITPSLQAARRWADIVSRALRCRVEVEDAYGERKNPSRTRSNPPRASKSSANEHNVRELFLYITNDGDLYRQRVEPIIKNLRLKVKKNKYDHALAIKIYQYLADDGARKYMKEYGTTGDRVDSTFTKVDRTQCAKELRDYYDDEVRG